jgi:uncharacterized protein Smg (DUF494 family)
MAKENTILDILLHIAKHHTETDAWLEKSPTLVNALKQKGYELDLIHQSLDWLITLFNTKISFEAIQTYHASMRIFSSEEYRYFSSTGINFILFLQTHGVLNTLTRELVIQQSMLLGLKKITIPLIKGIVALILFMDVDQTNSSEKLRKLNFLLLQNNLSNRRH